MAKNQNTSNMEMAYWRKCVRVRACCAPSFFSRARAPSLTHTHTHTHTPFLSLSDIYSHIYTYHVSTSTGGIVLVSARNAFCCSASNLRCSRTTMSEGTVEATPCMCVKNQMCEI